MKTDTLFYQLLKEYPSFFFELIGEPDTDPDTYNFIALEVKQRSFRLDGLFSPLESLTNEPLYFIEVQFYKEENFYDRLFAEIFVYFNQFKPPNPGWYAVVICDRRSNDVTVHPRYQELAQNRLRRIYLDELPATATAQSLGLGIIQLVVTSEQQTPTRARQLLDRATEQFPDVQQQQRVVQLIETIVVYKFPTLSREEIEAMLGLNELKQTRVYQEAKEEGREEGQLETKLAMIPLLLELRLSVEQISQRLEFGLKYSAPSSTITV